MRALDPAHIDERRAVPVGPGVLPGDRRVADDVEHVVGDLEGQPEVLGIDANALEVPLARARGQRPEFGRRNEQRPRLVGVDVLQSIEFEYRTVLFQVRDLPTDQAVVSDRPGQAGKRPARRTDVLETLGQQRDGGKDRVGLAVDAVQGRLAAPQRSVIHRRQVVKDQRARVDELHRRRKRQRLDAIATQHLGAGQHGHAPQSLPGRNQRVALRRAKNLRGHLVTHVERAFEESLDIGRTTTDVDLQSLGL